MEVPFWWERDNLKYINGQLYIGTQSLTELACSAGTPFFAYHGARIRDNLVRVRSAFEKSGLIYTIYYAIKANRFLPVLTYLKALGLCGIDVCSPGELDLALQAGFKQNEISYTGTGVSDEDLDYVQRNPHIYFNCDSISVIKRLGQRCPGRRIGIRINPHLGIGHNSSLEYAGSQVTKFGIYQNRYEEALGFAAKVGLKVTTLHFHPGSGYLTDQLDGLDRILEHCEWFLDRSPDIDTVNIGGGLGAPQYACEKPLDLDAWAQIIASHLKPRNLRVQTELGDYLIKDAGILVLEATTVEQKENVLFVYVNGGMNLQNLPAYYHINAEVVPLVLDPISPRQRITVAGNINEPIDIFAQEIIFQPVNEGDYIGLINVGGYGSSTGSNHSMRGKFAEYLIID